MKCVKYDGRQESMASAACGVGLQLNFGSGVALAGAARVPRAPAARPAPAPLLPRDPQAPFINDMDEITYWIHTKRAPCLMNYDNLIKKQSQEAECSQTVTKNLNEEAPVPKKRKRNRRLSILDDGSVSTEKQQHVYFEVSQRQNEPVTDDSKSDTRSSDVDFNLKNTSVGGKHKRAKVQKSHRIIHKKNKVVTSTPIKTENLRRSLRQAQLGHNSTHLNSSFQLLTSNVVNGAHVKSNVNFEKTLDKLNKSSKLLAAGDQTDNKRNSNVRSKSKPILNGQFEDLSDVSGFTANYIRSTKVLSGKTPRKLRCKANRNLVKESRHTSPNNSNMVELVNKSTNTLQKSNVLNCSTDSSQNVMNLVTKNNDKSARVDKSTSALKFMDTKNKTKDANKISKRNKSNLNVSFQSQSSGASRYPKRYKNHTDAMHTTKVDQRTDRRRRVNKNCIEFNNSDKKENPDEKVVMRTRSGRNIGLNIQRESSVLVVSNSTEQVSSMVSLNVASPNLAEQKSKRRTRARAKKSVNESAQQKDSLRDKSGFAACFSSDDSEPLVQRKFFCA